MTEPTENMATKIVHINKDNCATVVCDKCGKFKAINLDKHNIRSCKVTCRCGNIFSVKFERRLTYRKQVNLLGTCTNLRTTRQFEINILDISISGIRFSVSEKDVPKIDDILKVQFILDDIPKSHIMRHVIVGRVENNLIGAEFCDKITDKKLGFYLMP